MSEEKRGAKRLFLAVPFESGIRTRLDGQIRSMKSNTPGVRWVPKANLHITLFFFGNVRDIDYPELVTVLSEGIALTDPLHIAWRGLGGFPFRGVPRVLFFKLVKGAEQLGRLHDHLKPGLSPFLKDQERAYHPHITVGRVKYGDYRNLIRRFDSVEGKTVVNHLVLMESCTGPRGPEYRELASFR